LPEGNFYHLSGPVIANRLWQPTHPGDPPLADTEASNFNFRDLFGLSTPEVYRDPGRPGKP